MGEFGLGGLTKEHRATMGVEYSPPLSVTRRAIFRLDVSPSMFEVPESALTATSGRPARSSGGCIHCRVRRASITRSG